MVNLSFAKVKIDTERLIKSFPKEKANIYESRA